MYIVGAPVKYFCNSHLSAALPQTDPGGGGMSQDVSTNRLLGISLKPEMRKRVYIFPPSLFCQVIVPIYAFKCQNRVLKGLILITESDSYVIPAPGSAVIWLVINTATLYSERKQTRVQRQTCRRGYEHCRISRHSVWATGFCTFCHLQRSSAAWRASGPVSAAAQPVHPDQRSRLGTEP